MSIASDFFFLNTKKTKLIKRLVVSSSNVFRTLFASTLTVLLNYILLHYKAPEVLNTYVYCISVTNLILIVSGWGGKDFITKTIVNKPSELKETLNVVLSSKYMLLCVCVLVIFFLPIPLTLKLIISGFTVLKTLSSLIEVLIIVNKKFIRFLLIDILSNLIFILIICTDKNYINSTYFLFELFLFEFVKFIIGYFYFKKSITLKISITNGLNFIKKSALFFFISLASFAGGKGDLYIVGILLDKHQMSIYFILLNLVGLCLICFSALVGAYSATIFKLNALNFKNITNFIIKIGLLYSILTSGVIYFLCFYYFKISIDVFFHLLIACNIFIFTMIVTEIYYFTKLNLQRIIFKIMFTTGILNLLLAYFLVKFFGIKGAFLSNTLTLLFTILMFKLNHKRQPKSLQKITLLSLVRKS